MLGSEEMALPGLPTPELDFSDPETDENAGVENPILLYFAEIGAIHLLTAADEVRLGQQMEVAKERLLEVLQIQLPTLSGQFACRGASPAAPEAWMADVIQRVREWIARLERGQEVEVVRESGLSAAELRQAWAQIQHRQALPQSWSAVARPRPGGQSRPHAGSGEV